MSPRHITLVRGLPGAGKTTFAQRCKRDSDLVLEADDFFVGPNGVYDYDPARIGEAHQDCQMRARFALKLQLGVWVSNTFSARWEMEPYIEMAREHRVQLVVADLFDAGLTDEALTERCVHNVPIEVIRRMRDRWDHDWRTASPDVPW